MLKKLFLILLFSATGIAQLSHASWNNPYPESENQKSIIYSGFAERPKYLDPARAYAQTEYVFLGQIYEPPLQYHFLHRPYKLEPQTLTAMPKIRFLDAKAQVLSQQHIDNGATVAYTEYDFTLTPGILYQPHPALAKDDQGNYYYHQLEEAEAKSFATIAEFDHTGTRELTAHDYVHQIKRLATPSVHSPISGLMQDYIVGLKDLSETLQKIVKQSDNKEGYIDLRQHSLSGVKVINDYRFTIRLKGQYPQFSYWLAMPFFAPMPWEADLFYSQPGFKENNISLHWYPIGTGAYMLTENNPNLRMVLEKNPNFRKQTYPSDGEVGDREKGLLDDAGKTIPFVEKVIFSLEKESIPYWSKFLQGYFDSSGISSDSFDSAVSFGAGGDIALTDSMRKKGIELSTVVNTSIFYLGFNMLDPVIGGDSERARLLRQAISIAVDFEEYISIFSNGRGVAGQGPIPPGIAGHKEGEEGINPYIYQWKKGKARRKPINTARELMTQAGYKNGVDEKTGRSLVLYYESVDSGPDGKARLNWLRKQFKKLGIQLVIRSTDYNRFREKMSNGKAQVFLSGWNADYPDAENLLFLFHSKQGKVKHKGENVVNYSNLEFDRLFEQMSVIPDSPERTAIIDKMVNIVRHDAPWAFAFHPKDFRLNHSWLKNNKPFTMTNTGTLKYKRIDIDLRNTSREQWNKPVVWPIVAVIVLLILLVAPAIIGYRKHQRSRAL